MILGALALIVAGWLLADVRGLKRRIKKLEEGCKWV